MTENMNVTTMTETSANKPAKKSSPSKSPSKAPNAKAEKKLDGSLVKTTGRKSGPVEKNKELTPAQRAKLEKSLGDATFYICHKSNQIADSYLKIGFKLWQVKENKLYIVGGFKSVYEYAEESFGFKKSSVKNFIAICERFSARDENGKPTDKLNYQFILFGYTQLSVMLPLSDSQLSEVTPDMSKREIEGLRKSGQPVGQPKQKYSASPDVLFEGFVSDRTWDSLLDKLYELNGSPKKLRILVLEPDITDYASGAAFPAGFEPAK